MGDRKPIAMVKYHVDSILRLVTHSTQEQREEIAAEIARLDGGGVRLVLAEMAREALGKGDGGPVDG